MDSTANHRTAGHYRRLPGFSYAARLAPLLALSLMLAVPAVYAADEDNERPTASFTFSQSSPVAGERVTFTSTSRDEDGSIASQAWDLDNDGSYDDGTATTASRTFDSVRSYTVRLRVVDDGGRSRNTTRTVTVAPNNPPTAAFSASPLSPEAGQAVQFTSTSADPDGRPLLHEWDTDNDGGFDDATGTAASKVFPEPGVRRVSLRVTDSGGAVRTAFADITVRERPRVGARSPARARFLDPFPLVRIRGVTSRVGARLDLLSVRTPGGTRIVVRCKGGGCPWARRTRLARFARNRSREIKMPGFKRRHLRAGAVIEVFVIRRGMIGKYTRFNIRRLRAPMRTDGCTAVGAARRGKCRA